MKSFKKVIGNLIIICVLVLPLVGIIVTNLSGTREKARCSATKSTLASLESALEIYAMDTGQIPQSLDDLFDSTGKAPSTWRGPYIKRGIKTINGKKSIVDAFGNPIVYKGDPISGKYVLYSPGKDGRDDNASRGKDIISEGSSDIAMVYTPPKNTSTSNSSSEAPLPSIQMVVKKAEINLEVEDFQKAVQKITEIVGKIRGYISSTSINSGEKKKRSGSITVKVLPSKFEIAVAKLESVGKLLSKNIRGEDVSQEYVDLKTRLKSKKTAYEQIKEIMRRSGKITEVLKVTRELERINAEMEKIKGRMKYLKNVSAFSTIKINIKEPDAEIDFASLRKAQKRKEFSNYMSGTFSILWMEAVEVFSWVIKAGVLGVAFIIPAMFFLVVIVGFLTLSYLFMHRLYKRFHGPVM